MTGIPKDARVFVDESKAKGYYIAAAVVLPHDASNVEKELRKLTRSGQRRIHFNQESDSSRRTLLTRMAQLNVKVLVYSVKGLHEKQARELCLNALVDDIAAGGATTLVLERDAPVEPHDRRVIREALIRNNHYQLSYHHASPAEYATLWVSDAIAWCCNAGGEWRRRANSLIITHRWL